MLCGQWALRNKALRDGFGIVVLASAAAFCGAGNVRADEAYLCGPDSVVYVKTEELELKKRTDPCVAAYYGLKVEGKDGAEDAASNDNGAPPKSIVGKSAPDIGLKKSVQDRHRKPAGEENEQHAALMPAVAAPGTDFRHVRVINASSQDEEWFYHAR